MSQITLTKKRNGRYYLGMTEKDFEVLKTAVREKYCARETRHWPYKDVIGLERIVAALAKPARGEDAFTALADAAHPKGAKR